MRRVLLRRSSSGAAGTGGWKQRLVQGLQSFVKKTIPDPRDDPMAKRPVGYEDFRNLDGETANVPGASKLQTGETIEDYMKKRNASWVESNQFSPDVMKQMGLTARPDGTLFAAGFDRKTYEDAESGTKAVQEVLDKRDAASASQEDRMWLRRQLQMENESQYRKYVTEVKRSQVEEKSAARRRLPHPADPKYDPFKATPGYRPQDSSKLAAWLRAQKESGKTASGLSLSSQEGQDRFYNEEKMATQYYANPFATRVELPAGVPKMMVSAMSPDSFIIKEKEIIGSIIVTPSRYYHWNAASFEDVNERTLAVLLHMYPVPDVVFLGTGRNQYFVEEELRIKFMKRGTVLHCLTTKDACAAFCTQLSVRRKVCCALLTCVPTNPYKTECFGDFVENDAFCLSDTHLGIRAPRQFNPGLYRTNKVAEKYRHMVGTGIGPKYHVLPDGRLVRPGTSGTKLRPLVEPGTEIDWERLPSYYHWFPKERLEDYIENTTWREVAHKPVGDPAEKRMKAVLSSDQARGEEQMPRTEIMPWDSASIPLMKWPHLRDPQNVTVEDTKTGRLVGMSESTFAKWKQMMKDRKEGKEPTVEVEFDQETIVSDQHGRLMDMSKTRYVPLYEGRFHPRRQTKTGRGNLQLHS